MSFEDGCLNAHTPVNNERNDKYSCRCPNEFWTRLYPSNEKIMYKFHKNVHNSWMLYGTFAIFTGNKDDIIIFIILQNGWNQTFFTIILYAWSFKFDNFNNYVTMGKRRGYKLKVNGENTAPNSNMSARVCTLKHTHTYTHSHAHIRAHTYTYTPPHTHTLTHLHVLSLLIYTSACSVWSCDVLFPI